MTTSDNAGGPSLPLVSILIPCYNAEPWIAQCIQSALDAPYPHKEIIVLDDGSTDAGPEIIRKFGERVMFQPGLHAGANAARNVLTQLAHGEWLQYLDADDYLLPGKITNQIQLVHRESDEVDVVYSPMICHYPGQAKKDYITEINSDDEALNFIRWVPYNTIGILVRREAVLRAGGWKEDQPCCQEHELLLRLMVAGARFAASRTPGTVAQFGNSDSVSRKDPLRTVRIRMELTDAAIQHLKSTGRLKEEHRRALFIARMESARSAYSLDRRFAAELCRKAFADGGWWTASSPALPVAYQALLRVLGFDRSERLAAWRRPKVRSSVVQSPAGPVPSRPDLPLVSILVPCYNAAPWIGQAIQSALDQDYRKKEVIVVDDGSTDGSRSVISAFGSQIQYCFLPHAGGNAARNRLTEMARGEWLQYLDADDYLLQGKLKSQVNRMLACRPEVDVICSPVYLQNLTRPERLESTQVHEGGAFLNFIRWGGLQTTGMLFRRDAVLGARGWKEDQPCCQEHELLLRLLISGRGCELVKEPCSLYRYWSTGSVSTKDPLRTIRMRMELTDRAAAHLASTGQLNRAHRKALFIARLESARSAFQWDPEYSAELSAKALANGRYWYLSSPALRLRYQIALRLLGFERAERLAKGVRRSRIL